MQLIQLVRAATRGTRFILHLFVGVILGSVFRLRLGPHWYLKPTGQAVIRRWMQHGTRIVGIHVNTYGRPLHGKVLLVSNHISFLDILIISSVTPVRFLAKHSIRYWPIIGYLSTLSGSLYIERGKHRSLNRSLQALRHALSHPAPVLIFPEGTTSAGTLVLPFYSGLLQAALDRQVPVQALTLHYRHDEQADRLAAYIDKDNFLFSLLRLMARDRTEAHLSFTPAIDGHGHTRRSLAAFCHARISQNLAYQLHNHARGTTRDAATQLASPGECKT